MKLLNLFLSFISLIQIQAKTIYIDASNTSGTEDGTQAHPFNTIEEGIAGANPSDIIYIADGSYTPANDTLYIKPGITLQGESTAKTIILSDIKDTTRSDLSVGIYNLTFEDFIFKRGAMQNGNYTSPNIIKECKCENIHLYHGAGYINDTTPGPIPFFHILDNDVKWEITYGHGAGVIVGENKIINNKAADINFTHGTTILTEVEPKPEYTYLVENNMVSEGISFKQGPSWNTIEIVRNNKAGGIEIKSSSGNTYLITDNEIQNGISDESGANWTTIARNKILNGAIVDRSGGTDTLENEFIEDNIIYLDETGLTGDESQPCAIYESSQSATIRNNKITCKGKISGIIAKSGTPTNIIGNEISLDNVIVPSSDEDVTICGINTSAGAGLVTRNKIYGGEIGYFSKSGATLFADNEITNSYLGFYSRGAEKVKNNTIKNCKSHGMVLSGLRGPIEGNTIIDNDSSGIVIMQVVDLGGGADSCIGKNTIQNNGYYDLYVVKFNQGDTTKIFARNNYWDHDSEDDIDKYDIWDGKDIDTLAIVDFMPYLVTDIKERDNKFSIFNYQFSINVSPNPFSESTNINYELPNPDIVKIDIFNSLGSKITTIVDEWQEAGQHNCELRITNYGLSAGMYFYRLQIGDRMESGKLLLIK